MPRNTSIESLRRRQERLNARASRYHNRTLDAINATLDLLNAPLRGRRTAATRDAAIQRLQLRQQHNLQRANAVMREANVVNHRIRRIEVPQQRAERRAVQRAVAEHPLQFIANTLPLNQVSDLERMIGHERRRILGPRTNGYLIQFNLLFHTPTGDIERGRTFTYEPRHATPLRDIIYEDIKEYIDHNAYEASEYDLYDISNMNIKERRNIPLNQQLLRGMSLAMKLLGHVETNKNMGQCVIDYLMFEFQRSKDFKTIKRENVIKFFGDYCVEKGITPEQVLEYVKSLKTISLHILDPMKQEFIKHIAEGHRRLSLVFYINNGHVYGFFDDNVKRSIIASGKYNLREADGDLQFDAYDLYKGGFPPFKTLDDGGKNENNENYNKLIDDKFGNQKHILIDIKNLAKIAVAITEKTKHCIDDLRIDPKTGYVISFTHPTSRRRYITAEDYEVRKAMLEREAKLVASDAFKFRNQTYNQIANAIFKVRYGKIPKSTLSKELKHIYETYPARPIFRLFDEHANKKKLKTVDIRRCYTSCLRDNTTPWNVFHSFDEVRAFKQDEEVDIGEYYIHPAGSCTYANTVGHQCLKEHCIGWRAGSDTIKLTPHIVVPATWYTASMAKYMLSNNAITKNDIHYCIKPRQVLESTYFKEFVNHTEKYHKKASKNTINAFIGALNKMKIKNELTLHTQDFETVEGVMLQYPDAQIYNEGKSYFIRDTVIEPILRTNAPIYRQVIENSIIKLCEMYERLFPDPSVNQIISFNTDGVKFLGIPQIPLKNKDDVEIGEFGLEDKETTKLIHYGGVKVEPQYRLPVEPQLNKITKQEFIESKYNCSCLCTGNGGNGKTYLAAQMIRDLKDEKIVGLAFTNNAVNVLREYAPADALIYTFDSFFNEFLNEKGYLRKIANKDRIIIDEFSMIRKDLYAILNFIKMNNPNIKINIFGQCIQCKPVETDGVWYDYSKAQLIRYLTDYNQVELPYLPEFSRYDTQLNAALENVIRTHKIGEEFASAHLDTQAPANICISNKKRVAVNEEWFVRFSKNKTKYELEGRDPKKMEAPGYVKREYYSGMPLISYENNKKHKIWNSVRYAMDEVNRERLSVKVKKGNTETELPLQKLHMFDYGYCATVYKYQGATIPEPYNIHEIERMDFNELYTALSRGKKLSDIHFDYEKVKNKVFEEAKPNTEPLVHVSKLISTIKGKIYKIAKPDSTDTYIGCTFNTLDKRFEEHKLSPVNEKMKTFLADSSVEGTSTEKKAVITLIEESIVPWKNSKRELEKIETRFIKALKPTLNERCTKSKKVITADDIKIKTPEIKRFEPVHDEKKKAWIISYREKPTDKTDKKITMRYVRKGKDAVHAEAKEKQKELIKRFYGI